MSSFEIPTIKSEHGSTAGPDSGLQPNREPFHLSSVLQVEEDVYEDTGDLEFANTNQAVYLTRIPRFLWKSWSKAEDDDHEVCIGTIRMEGDLNNPKRLSILLSSNIAVNEDMPKEYNLQVTNQDPANTFIFTEKDLPGYGSRSRLTSRVQDRGSLLFSQTVPHRASQEHGRVQSAKVDKSRKWQSQYRRAIPKKTALAGQVRTEMNCLPVENEEYQRLMEERAMEVFKARRETQLLGGRTSAHAGNLLAPGTIGAAGNFGNFIKNTNSQRSRTQESKAARIPQNELLDLIGDCFKRYTYWPLKSLKADLNQPEAYLKQTLEMVAHLVRQGPHAMTWQLNRDAKIGAFADVLATDDSLEKTAPEVGNSFEGISDHVDDTAGEDEDEDLVKMEDVLDR